MPTLDATKDALASLAPEVIDKSWTAADLLARYAKAGAPVWADGDEFTFFYQGPADTVSSCCGIQKPLRRLPDTDLWTLTVRIPNLSQAVISYVFLAYRDGQPLMSPPDQEYVIPTWRGPEAPLPPERADTLQGQLQEYTLDGVSMDEPRKVTVYLPRGYDSARRYPVVYMGDGGTANIMAHFIEPLILSEEVPPLLLVGVHAAEDPEVDLRSQEYIPITNKARFAAHERFFVDEVSTWAEETLGAATDRDQRAIFGYSASAYFAIEMGMRHPDQYGNVIAFSVAGVDPGHADTTLWNLSLRSRYYLLAGTLEGYLLNTQRWADFFALQNMEYSLRERTCGHDIVMWQEEFPAAVRWALAPQAGE